VIAKLIGYIIITMGNDTNVDAVKRKIDPDVWHKMKIAAMSQNLKIYEWIELAIVEKLERMQ